MKRRLALLAGLGCAAQLFASPVWGEEPEKVAQAEEAEQKPPDPTADPDAAADPAAEKPADEPAAPAKPVTKAPAAPSGIEEIVVKGAESESASDFEKADSVTGFGAEDLAALGAQDIADLAAFTPNLEIVTAGATTPTFFIRGVGLNDFNPNSTGAVAIYQDDIPINAPAMQLSTLFDAEAVNVLRGPQGTGLARNASAGAIKLYSKKPTGEFGGYLRSEFGNYDLRDFEGAVEAPLYQDMLALRTAFRFTQRDGTMFNRCGNAPAMADRTPAPVFFGPGQSPNDAPWSICGEPVLSTIFEPNTVSSIPEGLPSWLNDVNNWAARGTLLFQPTLDMSWLINAHGSMRDEWSRVGQSIGTNGIYCTDPTVTVCNRFSPSRVEGLLGGDQGRSNPPAYVVREIREARLKQAPCLATGSCTFQQLNQANIAVANQLIDLDSEPWAGDFELCSTTQITLPGTPYFDPTNPNLNRDPTGTRCKPSRGKTKNNTFGGYLQGNIALPGGLTLTSATGYDHYNRFAHVDLDFSPEQLFEIQTDDYGWNASQSLQLSGELGDEGSVRWDIGGWLLREVIDVHAITDLTDFAVTQLFRSYTQDLWSSAGFLSLAFDFWDDFTLDGGFRYNWEQKNLDFLVQDSLNNSRPANLSEGWVAPTGTIRLTYRFREDTHAFWKYTRGWKPGTYNATASPVTGVTTAEPETIDAFETGLRGSWFEGRLGLDTSFFYYAYQDYQIFTAQQFSPGNPEFVIINANNAQVYGAEVDAIARPWPGAFANVRFGWLQTEFLDFVQLQQEETTCGGRLCTVNRLVNNTGNPLLNSPQFKVSLTGEQTIPLGRYGSLTARYDGVWTDTTYYDATAGLGLPNNQNLHPLPAGVTAQGPYWIHNLRLGYRLPGGRIEVAGWVRNLMNQSYKTFAFDASTFNKTSIYFVGDPRTFGGTLTVSF
jgi:outer membrane receptor protein involved in Fe transport